MIQMIAKLDEIISYILNELIVPFQLQLKFFIHSISQKTSRQVFLSDNTQMCSKINFI